MLPGAASAAAIPNFPELGDGLFGSRIAYSLLVGAMEVYHIENQVITGFDTDPSFIDGAFVTSIEYPYVNAYGFATGFVVDDQLRATTNADAGFFTNSTSPEALRFSATSGATVIVRVAFADIMEVLTPGDLQFTWDVHGSIQSEELPIGAYARTTATAQVWVWPVGLPIDSAAMSGYYASRQIDANGVTSAGSGAQQLSATAGSMYRVYGQLELFAQAKTVHAWWEDYPAYKVQTSAEFANTARLFIDPAPGSGASYSMASGVDLSTPLTPVPLPPAVACFASACAMLGAVPRFTRGRELRRRSASKESAVMKIIHDSESHPIRTALLACTALLAALPAAGQERTMNVRQGPDTVFDRPVDQLVPELAGATATNENGRVGNEMVFWGYRLAGGDRAYLFACALLENVDCEARVMAICNRPPAVRQRLETSGDVSHRICRTFATARPGDVRPGCTESEQVAALSVGLVQCR